MYGSVVLQDNLFNYGKPQTGAVRLPRKRGFEYVIDVLLGYADSIVAYLYDRRQRSRSVPERCSDVYSALVAHRVNRVLNDVCQRLTQERFVKNHLRQALIQIEMK